MRKFLQFLFFKSSDFAYRRKFFLPFLVGILPLGSGFVDPHFCASGSRKPKSCGSNGSGSGSLLEIIPLNNITWLCSNFEFFYLVSRKLLEEKFWFFGR